ncbi:hypothetical protein GE061_011558 [Apolygus lucorum]|uniref:UDP-glycosyltransferases domain-containing protein n=1 Tax=Apolygus lucorum TaxID=248454 RepID=A0A8S9Y0I1_APOLU|nr:hypothetical protein GE061_011558 [Apolygus lucorum]
MNKFVVLVVSMIMGAADSAKILGLLPFYGTSHSLVTVPLFEELAKKGHQVTVAGYFSPKTPNENYTHINFKPKPGTGLRGFLDAGDYENSNHMTTMYLINDILEGYDELMEMNNYNQILSGKYDLVIIEYFESDLFMAYANKLGKPFIVIHTCEAFPWHRDTLGDPISPSLVPQVFGQRGSEMDFFGRFWNTVEVIQMMMYYRSTMLPTAQKISSKHLGDLPPLNEITKNASLYLVNTHNSVYGPRPMNPATIEIGGIHVFPSKPLPKILKVAYSEALMIHEMFGLAVVRLLGLTITFGVTDAAKILGFLPFHGPSHNMVTVPLLEELAKRGHDVTVAGFYGPKTPRPNYKHVMFESRVKSGGGGITAEAFLNANHMTSVYLLDGLIQGYDEAIIKNNYNQVLDGKYDLVILEYFESDLFSAYASKLAAPFILIHTSEPMPWHRTVLGDPISPNVIPHSFGGRPLDFYGRLRNTIELMQMMWFYNSVMLPHAQQVAEKHLGRLPPLEELTKQASLYFVNTHSSVFGPRPTNPSTIEIGGVNILPSKPLPKSPMIKTSNMIPNVAHLEELAERGHKVTVAGYYEPKTSRPNFRSILFKLKPGTPLKGSLDAKDYEIQITCNSLAEGQNGRSTLAKYYSERVRKRDNQMDFAGRFWNSVELLQIMFNYKTVLAPSAQKLANKHLGPQPPLEEWTSSQVQAGISGLLQAIDASKILGFFPFHGPSHNFVFMSLMEELAKRGHDVTVAGYFEPKTPRPNFKSILFKLKPGTPVRGFWNLDDYVNSNHMTTMRLINDIFSNYEDHIPMNDYNQILEEKYDLVILEFFESDLFLGYASKIGAPYILFHSSEAIPWHRVKMGDPLAPNIIPNVFGKRSSQMDFMGRFWNTVELLEMMLYYNTVLVPSAQKLADKKQSCVLDKFLYSASNMLFSVARLLMISVVVLKTTDASKILGFFPFHGPSHNLVFMSLMEELAERGHDVTVAGYYAPKTPRPNFKSILFKLKPGSKLEGFMNIEGCSDSHYMTKLNHLMVDLFRNYEDLIPFNNYNQILDGKYDLVIVEYFKTDLFLGYASKIGAPYILFHTSEPFPWHRIKMGDPIAPNVIPTVFGNKGTQMDFTERFWNTIELIQTMVYYKTVMLPEAQRLANKFLGLQPPLEEWTANASLFFTNTHCSVLGPRPTNPSTIEVGGLNMLPAKPLSKDLKTLLDGAKNGVVYFSMGSVLKGSSMSADKRDAILKVFSELKETVLWKWEDELPYKPSNVHTSPWFPQRDIFAHPNIVLYIGHCGLLGIHEAVTEALPTICLPMFGDQHFNAAALKQNGMGLWLNYADINEELFRNTINQVLSNSSFKDNAKRVSAAFLDRPMSAMDTAVYWTEYVIRHKGAPHLRSPARWMTWYEYYNLDVIAILVSIPLIALILLYKMLVAFISTLFCRGPGSAQKKVKSS